MNKIIALFLVIALMGMNCATYEKGKGINLSPGQKPGAKLIIQKIDGLQIKGELIAIKQDSLLLKESESGADVETTVGEIKLIKIVRPSKALEWGLCSSIIISLVGLLIVSSPEDYLWGPKPSPPDKDA